MCDVVVHSLTLIERPAAPPAVSTSGLPAAQLSAGTTNSQQTPKPAAAGCYQLPVAVQECTVLVDSEAGLVQLEAALFDDAVDCSAVDATESSCASSSSDGTTETSSSSGGVASDEPRGFAPAGRPFRLVVGLDCEWQPFSSRLRELPTPVSLLQLATPDAVYLLDLLALCAEQGNGAGEVLEEGRAGGEGVPAGSRTSSSGSSTSGSSLSTTPEARASSDAGEQHEAALSPLQRRLSALMLRLFGDPSIIKAGFGLSTDLRRLCESYPWLPCFGADGAVPLRQVLCGGGCACRQLPVWPLGPACCTTLHFTRVPCWIFCTASNPVHVLPAGPMWMYCCWHILPWALRCHTPAAASASARWQVSADGCAVRLAGVYSCVAAWCSCPVQLRTPVQLSTPASTGPHLHTR